MKHPSAQCEGHVAGTMCYFKNDFRGSWFESLSACYMHPNYKAFLPIGDLDHFNGVVEASDKLYTKTNCTTLWLNARMVFDKFHWVTINLKKNSLNFRSSINENWDHGHPKMRFTCVMLNLLTMKFKTESCLATACLMCVKIIG